MATTMYTAIIEKEGDVYAALCPELDVASQGATVRGDFQSARGHRVEAWVGLAPCRDAQSVQSFSSGGSSRCADAEVMSSCGAGPTPTARPAASASRAL
jgi:hypothetical protein